MNIPIGNSNDLNSFRDALLKAKKKVKTDIILSDIKTDLSIDDLNLLDLSVDTMRPAVTIRAFGNIGIYSAMLLTRQFKRYGYMGYSIDMKIPDTVPTAERQKIQDRMLRLCKDDKRTVFQPRLLAGDIITVEEALDFGLLDKIVDPQASRRKTPSKGVTVATDTPGADSSKTQ